MGYAVVSTFVQAYLFTYPSWQQFPNQQELFLSTSLAVSSSSNPFFVKQQAVQNMSSHNLSPKIQFSQYGFQ
ncbi:17288_t:CDS:1, partial [Racocetra fulgida]